MAVPVINQLITMVLLMIAGFIMKKRSLLTNEGIGGISTVLTKLALPAMLIALFQRDFSKELLIQFGLACLGAAIMTIGMLAIYIVLGRLLGMQYPKLGLFAGCGAYCNVSFMGQPLVLAIFGEAGLIYCVATIFVQNVVYVLIISSVMSHKCKPKKTASQLARAIFLNPICAGAAIGFLLFIASIRLPLPVRESLEAARATTVCLSMIIIGALLANANIKTVVKDKVVYIFSFFSLVVTPILAKALLGAFMDGVPLGVVVILMATPAAAALPALSRDCGNDELRASEYVFVSTIFSVITLPLVAVFLC